MPDTRVGTGATSRLEPAWGRFHTASTKQHVCTRVDAHAYTHANTHDCTNVLRQLYTRIYTHVHALVYAHVYALRSIGPPQHCKP